MLVYVACRGIFLPAALILNLPLLALYLPFGAALVFADPVRGSLSLAGAVVVWAPVVYLAWRGLKRLPPRLTMVLCLLAIAFALALLLAPGRIAMLGPANSANAVGSPWPPQLWSDHKHLKVPPGACAELAVNVLTELGYADVVRNGHYSYGNLAGNRAAVKCVGSAEGSFVYFAVAGAQREVVEQLRNQIARKL
jgi:hypothetical protein